MRGLFKKSTRLLVCWYAKLKYWHTVSQVGTPSWNIDELHDTLARLLACLHVKIRSWPAFGTLARKPRCHASSLARRQRWHAGTHGTQFSKLKLRYCFFCINYSILYCNKYSSNSKYIFLIINISFIEVVVIKTIIELYTSYNR